MWLAGSDPAEGGLEAGETTHGVAGKRLLEVRQAIRNRHGAGGPWTPSGDGHHPIVHRDDSLRLDAVDDCHFLLALRGRHRALVVEKRNDFSLDLDQHLPTGGQRPIGRVENEEVFPVGEAVGVALGLVAGSLCQGGGDSEEGHDNRHGEFADGGHDGLLSKEPGIPVPFPYTIF